MRAILTTLCGCTRELEVSDPPMERITIACPLHRGVIDIHEPGALARPAYKQRAFELEYRKRDAAYYTEQPE